MTCPSILALSILHNIAVRARMVKHLLNGQFSVFYLGLVYHYIGVDIFQTS